MAISDDLRPTPDARPHVARGREAGTLRLVTIPISHFCEKARWALDRAGLAFTEERHVQGVHRIAARRAGGGTTVPVLVTPEGVFGESAQILAWADQWMAPEERLFPSDPSERAEVERLCRRFDDVLGPASRRLIYFHVLQQPDSALPYNNQGVPHWEAWTLRHGWPLAAGYVRRELGIGPTTEADDTRVVWAEFDHAAGLLTDGRPFLCGDGFTAADLTFACMSAAVIAPPEYGVVLPQPDAVDPATAALVRSAREHPAGAFAMRMFAEHRRRPVR
jgi:glutathione S-transferase